jgi:hypothetical protein
VTITEAHAMILAALPREKDGRLRHAHFIDIQSGCYNDETFSAAFSVAIVPGIAPGIGCSRWTAASLKDAVEKAIAEIDGKPGKLADVQEAISSIPGMDGRRP